MGSLDPAPPPSSDAARQRFIAQPVRDTAPEKRIRSELFRRGLRYRVDYQVLSRPRRRADIVFPARKVAVFIDGCFWHRCPEHGSIPQANRAWWTSKLQLTVDRDRDTDLRLRQSGWIVIRIWEHESSIDTADRIAVAVSQVEPTAR